MSHVLLERRDDGVRVLTLNRPDRMNALSFELVDELADVLGAIGADDEARCLVITGSGRGFCAGADLTQFTRILDPDPVVAERNVLRFHRPAQLLWELPIPTIAAINGPAVGGGAGIALLCDIRLAGESAMIRIIQPERAIVPDMGATYTLPMLVGLARANDIVLRRRAVSSEECLRIGLVSEIVPDAVLGDLATEWASDLARLPRRALRLTRTLLRGTANGVVAALAAEAAAQGQCANGPEVAELLAAAWPRAQE